MKVYTNSKFKNLKAPRPSDYVWPIGLLLIMAIVVALWAAFTAGFIAQWLIAINKI